MALTVHQQPQAYTPAYNDQFILALSNQIAQPDFKYIVTVKVNGGTEYTLDVLQRPDGYVVVNPIEIVKNYITRDWFNPTFSIMQAQGYSCDVLVKVKEYYSGAIQSTTNVNYFAIDMCLDNETFSHYNYTDYITVGSAYKVLNASIGGGLTNADNRVTLNTNYWLQFFNSNVATRLTYTIYDDSLTILTTSNIILKNNFNCIDIGKSILTGHPSAYFVEIDINDGITSYYSTGYYVTTICSKFTTYPLYFLDRLGTFSYMWFNQLTSQTIYAKRSNVRLGANKIVDNTYGSNNYDRERHNVNTETTKTIKLTSGWLTEEQSLKLVDLFDSPIVWFVKNGTYYPVSVTDSNYTINEHEYEPLFNYVVNLEFDKTEIRQRGI